MTVCAAAVAAIATDHRMKILKSVNRSNGHIRCTSRVGACFSAQAHGKGSTHLARCVRRSSCETNVEIAVTKLFLA